MSAILALLAAGAAGFCVGALWALWPDDMPGVHAGRPPGGAPPGDDIDWSTMTDMWSPLPYPFETVYGATTTATGGNR